MLSGTDYKRAAILHDGADGWNFICARLRVPHVAQLGFTVASFLFGHHRIPRRGGRRPSHFSELHLRVAGLLGIESSDSMPKLYVTAAEAERARIEFGDVLSVTPCVVIHPFGVTTRFNFGTEAYKRLAGLVSAMTSVPVFFVGTPQERELLGTVDPRHISCRLLREALPLRTLMAIMGQADLVIGGSSGITHMGAALGVPTIGLFCPSNNEAVLWRPRGPAAECLTVSPGLCPRLARNRFACRNVSFCDISFGIPEERILHAVRSSLNRSARIGRSAHTGT
jgi:ADP-heptose:LPS heptosyltransferase